MCPGQPLPERSRSLIRRLSVERHEGSRHTRDAHDAGAPPVGGYRRNFDKVRMSCDGFLEMTNGDSVHGCARFEIVRGATILRTRPRQTSEAHDEGVSTPRRSLNVTLMYEQKIFCV